MFRSNHLYILFWQKSWSTGGASHHSAFTGSSPTISHTFLDLPNKWMSSSSRKWEHGISSRLYLIVCDWCESGELGGRCNSSGGNLLIQSCQTSATELLCENSQWPKHVDCFHKSAPLQTSNQILNKDATRSVVDVGCGWNASAWNL